MQGKASFFPLSAKFNIGSRVTGAKRQVGAAGGFGPGVLSFALGNAKFLVVSAIKSH